MRPALLRLLPFCPHMQLLCNEGYAPGKEGGAAPCDFVRSQTPESGSD
jgi:hypothetical protein